MHEAAALPLTHPEAAVDGRDEHDGSEDEEAGDEEADHQTRAAQRRHAAVRRYIQGIDLILEETRGRRRQDSGKNRKKGAEGCG